MKQALVTVVVPTKNSSQTLRECLESINNQTYNPIQIIVVDNFSSDSTPVIARKYTDNFYSIGPERSSQRNYAAKKAKGKYICIIDSDMKLGQKVIQECVEKLSKNPGFRGVIIPEESFGSGFWAQCKRLERSFYLGVPYMEAARFFHTDDFLKLGGYNESMVSGEDWDLSQRIETLGKLGRIRAMILHNEGHISLLKTIRKKFYYAKSFATYTSESNTAENVRKQISIVGRYSLFFSKPGKLFRNPVLGIGMLFMKTAEFLFGGLGYFYAKFIRN